MNQKISHYFKIRIFVKLSEDKAQTMEAKSQKGLYFIEEVIDVTGHLGEYNFLMGMVICFVAGQDV